LNSVLGLSYLDEIFEVKCLFSVGEKMIPVKTLFGRDINNVEDVSLFVKIMLDQFTIHQT